MKQESFSVNPFSNHPQHSSSSSFAIQEPRPYCYPDSSPLEHTFNQISCQKYLSKEDSFQKIKVENPFNKQSPFLYGNNIQKKQKKINQNHPPTPGQQGKQQVNSYYIAGKHNRNTSSFQKNTIQSVYQYSQPEQQNKNFSEKGKKHQHNYTQSPNISQFDQPLSPNKVSAKNYFLQQQSCFTTSQQQHQYQDQLEQKDQQIRMLKLQLQRYRRCEHINKQNEAIYRKLVKKLKNQFQQIKDKAQSSQPRDQTEKKYVNISQTTRFIDPETIRNSKIEQLFGDIKTPLNLVKNIDSYYVAESRTKQQHPEQQRNAIINPCFKKNSGESNTLTFNAKKQKPKDKCYNKRIINQTLAQKVYQNQYQEPDYKEDRRSFGTKLTEINQKLWNKQSDNKSFKSSSFRDRIAPEYRKRIESNKHMINYYN